MESRRIGVQTENDLGLPLGDERREAVGEAARHADAVGASP